MLYLHLVQHGQVVAVPRELRPHEGPERCVLDLMVVVELLFDVAPGPGQPSRPLRSDARHAHRGAQSLQVTPKRLVDQVDDGEAAPRRTVAGSILLPTVHGHPLSDAVRRTAILPELRNA